MTAPSSRVERMTADMEAVMAAMPIKRRRFRRPLLWSLLLLTGVAGTAGAAATVLDRGSTLDGVPYEITRSDRDGQLCLQLRYNAGAPAYGCGRAPNAANPLGLLVVDRRDEGGVAYGLVDASIERVRVAGVDAKTEMRDGVPGRFFVVRSEHLEKVKAVGYRADGREITLSGGGPSTEKRRSRADAAAAGDPAGTAPSVDFPSSVRYHDKSLPDEEIAKRGLVCNQDRSGVQCFDTAEELARETGIVVPGP